MDPVTILIIIPVVLLSIAIHEWAHAYFADLAGDPTPRMMGRVTLNPIKHLDPLGTIMIVLTSITGFGIGWGKPVMVNPTKMRNPRWDHFTSVAAGPLSNLIQAVIYAVVLRFVVGVGTIQPTDMSIPQLICLYGIIVNVSLMLFNLIPLGPLDGHWLVGAFLPDPARYQWYKFNQTTGSFLLLGLVLGGQLIPQLNVFSTILQPISLRIMRFLLGVG